jgi:hypothetical protein
MRNWALTRPGSDAAVDAETLDAQAVTALQCAEPAQQCRIGCPLQFGLDAPFQRPYPAQCGTQSGGAGGHIDHTERGTPRSRHLGRARSGGARAYGRRLRLHPRMFIHELLQLCAQIRASFQCRFQHQQEQ